MCGLNLPCENVINYCLTHWLKTLCLVVNFAHFREKQNYAKILQANLLGSLWSEKVCNRKMLNYNKINFNIDLLRIFIVCHHMMFLLK